MFQGVITDGADGGQQNDHLNKMLYITEGAVRQCQTAGWSLKGTVPRDFRLQVFLMNQFPQSP